MNIRFFSLALSVSLLLLCSVSAAAFADGMPFRESPPKQNLTPLDKALNYIQNKEDEGEPAPIVVEAPKSEVPPVPESRVVEVQPNTSFFGLSVGMYDPFTHSEKATSFNVEWQPGVKVAGVLQPLFGAIVTTRGSMLGYGGFGVPFNINERVFMMPSVAVGAYRKGDGYDLDHTLAFRVGTELAYQFDDKSRIGLNMHVLSNGTSLGRRDRTEIIGLAYTVPLEKFTKPAELFYNAAAAPTIAPAAGDITNNELPSPAP